MSVKAVFFDIDGTLLTDNRTVSRSTIAAINSLKRQGILVGLATGRDPRFVLRYMASLGLDCAVVYNGQYILSRERLLYANPLTTDEIASMIAYAQKQKKDLSFGTGTGVLGSGILNFGSGNMAYRLTRMIPPSWASLVNFIINRWLRPLLPIKDYDGMDWHGQAIYQLMLLATKREMRLLQADYPNLTFTRSSAYTVDVLSKGVSKRMGIARLGEEYQFDLSQVMVFGDSDNDIDMLSGAGYSVAMGNATRHAKQAASYVTTSNNHDGIFQALVHFGVIQEE